MSTRGWLALVLSIAPSAVWVWLLARPDLNAQLVLPSEHFLVVTLVSVLVALVVGTIEVLSIISSQIGLSGGIWSLIGKLDFGAIGFIIIGIFIILLLLVSLFKGKIRKLLIRDLSLLEQEGKDAEKFIEKEFRKI